MLSVGQVEKIGERRMKRNGWGEEERGSGTLKGYDSGFPLGEITGIPQLADFCLARPGFGILGHVAEWPTLEGKRSTAFFSLHDMLVM